MACLEQIAANQFATRDVPLAERGVPFEPAIRALNVAIGRTLNVDGDLGFLEAIDRVDTLRNSFEPEASRERWALCYLREELEKFASVCLGDEVFFEKPDNRGHIIPADLVIGDLCKLLQDCIDNVDGFEKKCGFGLSTLRDEVDSAVKTTDIIKRTSARNLAALKRDLAACGQGSNGDSGKRPEAKKAIRERNRVAHPGGAAKRDMR